MNLERDVLKAFHSTKHCSLAIALSILVTDTAMVSIEMWIVYINIVNMLTKLFCEPPSIGYMNN